MAFFDAGPSKDCNDLIIRLALMALGQSLVAVVSTVQPQTAPNGSMMYLAAQHLPACCLRVWSQKSVARGEW